MLSSWLVGGSIPAPGVRWYFAGEQEHLHHGTVRERFHQGASGRLQLHGRFAHIYPDDALDLLPQRSTRLGE